MWKRCFGRSLYPPQELALHRAAALHRQPSRLPPLVYPGRARRQAKPCAPTRSAFSSRRQSRPSGTAPLSLKNNDLYQSAILRLTEHIRNCMQVQQQPDAVSARQGHVWTVTRIWRLPVLNDGRVFLRSEEESNPGFTVDLLLDGSASRLHCQETIAAQGYILASSLATCGIPVRVSSFCSLRGYTVAADSQGFQREKRGKKNFQLLCRRLEPGRTGAAHGGKAAGYRSGRSASAASC